MYCYIYTGVDPSPKSGHREVSLRRSGPENLNRAKSKTLRMTIIIVAVFIMCWTPYYILCLWFLFDSQSALKLDFGVQKGLFIFAASNSCMNPLVYGFFMVKCACLGRRAQVKRTPLWCWFYLDHIILILENFFLPRLGY